MVKKRSPGGVIAEVTAVVVTLFTHWIIFYFVIVNSAKSNQEAARMSLAFPSRVELWENIKYVVTYRNNAIIQAFFNSLGVTVWTMVIIVSVASMAAFILQRRKSNILCRMSNKLVVACMTVPA